MTKLHTIDITLEEEKELVGVRTNGNTIAIVYSIEGGYRPMVFHTARMPKTKMK